MLLSLLRRYEGWFSFAFVLALIIAGFAGFQTLFGYQPPPTPTPVAIAQANTPTLVPTIPTTSPTATVPPTTTPTTTQPPSPTAVPTLAPTDTVGPTPPPTATPVPAATPVPPTDTATPPANQPPMVQAALVPIDIDDDREAGVFQIQVTATDPENALQSTLIILKLPASDQERKIKQKEAGNTEVKFTNKQLEIKAPDPQALLDQINAYGGIIVQNGEQIDLRFRKKGEGELRGEDKGWRLEARTIELEVVAIDSAGLTSTAGATACLQESC